MSNYVPTDSPRHQSLVSKVKELTDSIDANDVPHLNSWEVDFLRDMKNRIRYTEKMEDKIHEIFDGNYCARDP